METENIKQDNKRIELAMEILRNLYDESLSSMSVEDIRTEINEALSLLRRLEIRNIVTEENIKDN